MNERAREALVAAALSGEKQARGVWRDADGNRCAMTVLIDAARKDGYFDYTIELWAELDEREYGRIVIANDVLDWDFLMIARKVDSPEYNEAIYAITNIPPTGDINDPA